MKKIVLLLLVLAPFLSKGQYMVTIAGNGTFNNSGDGGPASAAELGMPRAVAIDRSGNVYITIISPGARIRKITPAGIISTFAGGDTIGYNGDGIPATAAFLDEPRQVAFDGAGNVYICGGFNHRIHMVNPAGIISTFAGDGTGAYGGDGGPATAAQLNFSNGMDFDAAGNAYISDNFNHMIRKINTSGIISTIAGTGTAGYSGNGGPATNAMINNPNRIMVVGTDVYFTEQGNACLRKVNAAGIISTVAGDGFSGYFGDGGPATAAEFNAPAALCKDVLGNIYIADTRNNVIRVINTAGIINTYAGTGIAGFNGDCLLDTLAQLDTAYGVAIDASGSIYIADQFNFRIRKINALPCVTGVNDVTADQESITVFPNPATAELTITCPAKINQVAISNIMGQTIYNKAYNTMQVVINVADLPAGVYFAKINGTEVKRFLKQ